MTNYEIIKRLYKSYTSKFINKIALSVLFSLFVAASTSSIAWLLDPAIEKIFIEKDQSLIIIIPILIIIAFFVKGTSMYFAKSIMIGVGADIRKMLQSQMLSSLIKADTDTIDKNHSGKFISNITFDVHMITNLLSQALLGLFRDSLTLIGLISVMFYQNWKLTLVALLMIPLAVKVTAMIGKRVKKVATETQERSGFLNKHLIEIFKNHKLIKIFQKESHEDDRSKILISNYQEKQKKMDTTFQRPTPFMETMTGIMIAVLIFFAGKLILENEISVNNFFSFLAAMMLAYQPVRSLAVINLAYNQGISGAQRVLPIIDDKREIVDKDNSFDLKLTNANILFKNVSFKYSSKETRVLDNIDINFIGGKMTALVGLSGSGKSTILNLIPRFYNISSGDILIDEQSIYDVKIQSLRNKISLVSQDTTLFDDTIKNNILYANSESSEEEMISAAKLSFADEFIQNLPNKYDTIIGENGVRLSGGEKQRLSIARAMLKKSSIILLDEATSSLDSDTEEKIQKALEILTKNRTTIVIAHRLSTILNSEKIYVVDSGKIVDSGKHEELLSVSEKYKNFYQKQIKRG